MRPALHPHDDGLIESLGCEVDDGRVRPRRSPTGHTSVSGVWAAGNASNPRAQVITAAGEGSAAAIAINTDLVQEDVQNALSRVAAAGDERASLNETGGSNMTNTSENRPRRFRRRASTSSH